MINSGGHPLIPEERDEALCDRRTAVFTGSPAFAGDDIGGVNGREAS
jgi:hypothetical protein